MSNGTTADGGQKPGTGGWRETIGIVLLIAVSGFPAAGKAGFFGGDWGLSLPEQMALSTGGGAIAGWLIAPNWHWAGIVGGAIAGPCGYFALVWWATGRQQIYKLELVVAQAVGSLPGLLVYLGLYKLTGPAAPPEEPIPDEYRRPMRDEGE